MNSSNRPGLLGTNPPNKQNTTQQSASGSQRGGGGMKEEIYEDVDTILKHTIDEIWAMFDDDGNGLFDPEETTSFIRHTLIEMG